MSWEDGFATTGDLSPIYNTTNFTSQLASTAYGAGDTFMTHKFKFRLRSEHTIEGQDFDMELQLIYLAKNPENSFFYSVVSILFDRKNFTKAKVTPK